METGWQWPCMKLNFEVNFGHWDNLKSFISYHVKQFVHRYTVIYFAKRLIGCSDRR